MVKPSQRIRNKSIPGLEKCPTGITGLDEIAEGGLPRGRPTLVCGGAGCGKTLFAMEFIVRGILNFGEPGVFMAFEETAEELADNVASLGFDVGNLVRQGKLAVDHVRIERSEIEETGEYDLEGLFVRLGTMIDQVGAKRVALDTVEALFAGLPSEAIVRAELRRLFRWLKERGVTAIITAEQGEKTLTRFGLEEYVSDCVIFLDHRIMQQVATRRLRIIKYRGSRHGTNEYPTLIDREGLSVLPISSLGLTYPVTSQRVSSGIARLDEMLGGKGYFRGSSVLISGTAGTGKTSMASAFVNGLCRRGKRCMYFSFEESSAQIIRNMRSIGFDLGKWVMRGSLKIHALRPQLYGLEMHLANIHKLVTKFKPDGLVMDPVTGLTSVGNDIEIRAMLTRVIDFLKSEGITSIYTSLTGDFSNIEQTEVGISSLMDTWLLVRNLESENERNRLIYILKSRGMSHSNQMREFKLTDRGIEMENVYVGPGRVLTGAARLRQESVDKAEVQSEKEEMELLLRQSRQEQASLNAQIEALRVKLENTHSELKISQVRQERKLQAALREQQALARRAR